MPGAHGGGNRNRRGNENDQHRHREQQNHHWLETPDHAISIAGVGHPVKRNRVLNSKFSMVIRPELQWQLAILCPGCENRPVQPATTIDRGAVVLVTLREPREKYWGVVLEITAAGVSISGIALSAFDDFARLVRDREPASSGVVFFPLHRVERVELDLPSGEIPSLRQRFAQACGRAAESVLLPEPPPEGR
jgi:hypothetical protein